MEEVVPRLFSFTIGRGVAILKHASQKISSYCHVENPNTPVSDPADKAAGTSNGVRCALISRLHINVIDRSITSSTLGYCCYVSLAGKERIGSNSRAAKIRWGMRIWVWVQMWWRMKKKILCSRKIWRRDLSTGDFACGRGLSCLAFSLGKKKNSSFVNCKQMNWFVRNWAGWKLCVHWNSFLTIANFFKFKQIIIFTV